MPITPRNHGVGARKAKVFQLNASGSPDATSTTVYAGDRMWGVKSLELTVPEPRRITHVGDDGPIQVDVLPPTEAITGEIIVSEENQDLIAILANTLAEDIGEVSALQFGTDQMGYEPQVGLLVYQQALNASGVRNWRSIILPKTTLHHHPASMNENPAEHRFSINPAVTTAYLWEHAYALGDEGVTKSQGAIYQSTNPLGIASWLADGAAVEFLFPTDEQLADAATPACVVFQDGTVAAPTSYAADKITYAVAPTLNKRIVAVYEIAV